MSDKRYTNKFKVGAVKQIIEYGYSVQDVSERLGGSSHSLSLWRKKFGDGVEAASHLDKNQAEIKRLRELCAECCKFITVASTLGLSSQHFHAKKKMSD